MVEINKFFYPYISWLPIKNKQINILEYLDLPVMIIIFKNRIKLSSITQSVSKIVSITLYKWTIAIVVEENWIL